MWLLAGVFCVLAVIRLFKNDFVIEADTMLYIASAGVIINILYVSIVSTIEILSLEYANSKLNIILKTRFCFKLMCL